MKTARGQAPLFHRDAEGSAAMSDEPEPLYRYSLGRRWGETGRRVNFIMLNPSKADALNTDPTLTRCVGFAKAWGFDGLVITNLFALRSTDRRVLKTASDPVGPINDLMIGSEAARSDLIVCAWGTWGTLRGRDREVWGLLDRDGHTPHVLRLTTDGHPEHPLYLPGHLRPTEWGGPRR